MIATASGATITRENVADVILDVFRTAPLEGYVPDRSYYAAALEDGCHICALGAAVVSLIGKVRALDEIEIARFCDLLAEETGVPTAFWAGVDDGFTLLGDDSASDRQAWTSEYAPGSPDDHEYLEGLAVGYRVYDRLVERGQLPL